MLFRSIGSSSSLDEAFYAGAKEIYAQVEAEYDANNSFPSQWLQSSPADYAQVLETAFGWHMILATGGSVASSAKFTADDDSKANDSDEYMIYERIEYTDADGNEYYLNAYSDTDAISANQVQIYLNEKDSEYGVESLPSSVSTAITAYLAPVYAKFTGSQNQLNLLYRLLDTTNYNFASAANNEKAERLVEINQDQFFSYIFDNVEFNEVYGDWWTNF